ncbi:hypothetical protein [Niveibacterium sp.]|uniref:hypothetical protein n=1 Tax=Niveibacterium sp. TaxID=2017444 RepID=UPI0035B07C39
MKWLTGVVEVLLCAVVTQSFAADPVQDALVPPPRPDAAQLVFLDPHSSASSDGFMAGIYELNGNTRTLLTVINSRQRRVLDLPAGQHTLMSYHPLTKSAHIMLTDAEPGQRYYVIMRFAYGQGLQMRPIRPDNTSEFNTSHKKFPTWLSASALTADAVPADWDADWQSAINESQGRARVVWSKKTDEQRAELTLRSEDRVEF